MLPCCCMARFGTGRWCELYLNVFIPKCLCFSCRTCSSACEHTCQTKYQKSEKNVRLLNRQNGRAAYRLLTLICITNTHQFAHPRCGHVLIWARFRILLLIFFYFIQLQFQFRLSVSGKKIFSAPSLFIITTP